MSRDKIIERVINKIKARSDVGYKKYGVTLKDDDQPLDLWLTHIQEELMDAVNYIEKAKEVLSDEIDLVILNSIDVRDEEKI
jgi:fructose-1,6-bisphosphatase